MIPSEERFLQFCRFVIPKEKLDRYGQSVWPYALGDGPPFKCTLGSLFEESHNEFEQLKKAFIELYHDEFQRLQEIRMGIAPTATTLALEEYRKWKNRNQTK